ncbi:Sfp Phosphopantetheinyl transferase [Pyrenophora tritici-repentis]|uniref:holo-[acyl-carrier-protein] synthase n=1 Tax=Pyrenophora tritici-repentis TaxID=45151 RepID=A0A2W1ENP1_9PLEO|nr:phosphopantetheinyl transferase [Pyrenophora tritici-repentis]KAF7453398.1 phosphopantetheinyl transferase [Pyrenophora tritici-repentis]KAF7576468.1 Sfp, Phosphopantetheinyl transferase [Pyrenophora tritici-repentis]KAG9387151.1 phosphopantetheinyl transferase [Pyrenophora tritici-repentis]KAI0577889.1 phosphopantetheinyl transferase [Pyrenophora tritici-repentis]
MVNTVETEPTSRGLTCWLLDTRSLWPGVKITDSASAREALSLISPEERELITRKYHIADARMSLGSALLKRLFVNKALGIPWKDIRFGRKRDPKHGKPIALLAPPQHGPAPLEFNISHQAGLVALVGCKTDELDAEVGVDIVCVNERNDYRVVDEEGFDSWVDVYSEIFSQEESFDLKYNVDPFPLLDGTIVTQDMLGRHDRCCTRNQHLTITLPNGEKRSVDSDLLIDAKLRRFYTYWCYKEAYIKLDGEALLAQWIPCLEFKHVRAPRPGTPARCSTHGSWGERISDAEVWFSMKADGKGPAGVRDMTRGESRKLDDTRVEIQAFEENFMIGVAARERTDPVVDGHRSRLPNVLTHFKGLHLEEDVIAIARMSSPGSW